MMMRGVPRGAREGEGREGAEGAREAELWMMLRDGGAGARLVQPRLPFLPHVARDTISTDGANSDMRDSG